jgi:hypothetical protein
MRLLTLLTSTLCLLTACELPSKLGDLPDDEDTADASGTSGTSAGSAGSAGTTTATTATATDGTASASDGTTTADEPSSTTEATPQTSGEPDTTTTTTTGVMTGAESTGQSDGCAGLDESGCLAAFGCDAYYGTPYEFEGCTPGSTFLGCGPVMDCDEAFTTVCRAGTDEVYLVPTSCAPAGFEPCDKPGLTPCGGECGQLDEVACQNDSDFCEPIYGLQHVEQEGLVCVDQTPKYLACISMDGACPPFIPTVCSTTNEDEKYDIPSGCLVPGFEQCEPEGAQPCP